MRIAHIGDLHIDERDGIDGRIVPGPSGLNIRIEDIDQVLTGMVDSILAHQVDLVLCAGDIFARPYLTNDEIRIARREFLRLANGLPPSAAIIIIPGNHDIPGMHQRADALVALENISKRIIIQRTPGKVAIGDADIFCVPYPHRKTFLASNGNGLTPDEVFARINEILEQLMLKMGAAAHQSRAAGRVPLLLAHMAVVGARSSTGWEAGPREPVLNRDLLEPYSYAAFGHIHLRQEIRPNAWYCGSPMIGDFGEAEDRKGWLLALATSRNGLTVESIDLTHLSRRFVTIDLGDYESSLWDLDALDSDAGAVVRICYRIPEIHDIDMEPLRELRRALMDRGALAVIEDREYLVSNRSRIDVADERAAIDIEFHDAFDLVAEVDGNQWIAEFRESALSVHEFITAGGEA